MEGFAAGLLSSLAIVFSNASNPDDLMAGSSMSPRISLSVMTSRARVLASSGLVDCKASAGKIKESLAAINDENRFPSGLTHTQVFLILVEVVPSL